MIEINLVPDVKQELLKAQRVRSTVISFSIIIGIISLGAATALAVYAFPIQTLRNVVVDDSIKKGAAQLGAVSDLSKTLTIQNQLTKISSLHDSAPINSRIFDVLLAIIPPAPNTVQISTLTSDAATSTITIDGQAANSYAAVEVFKKTIESAVVKFKMDGNDEKVALATDIKTSNTSYGEDATGTKVLRFTLSFTYAPELFAVLSENATVSVTEQGNATDSYLGLPKSIFVDQAADLTGEN
jgi:Tfp pilus assembly protein PilN